jgi:trimethylamine--corrinoid protein Co-methyltransferase
MWQGIPLHDPGEEVTLIKSRTPRGSFISAPHTLRHYREHWYPGLISRDTYATWLEKGETIESKCHHKAQQILDHHRPPPLPVEKEAALEHIMRRFLPDFHCDP